eukprot:m.1194733 g.1194733  ORF g.1194733 m.1194733 type:complete len:88 (-) comp24562_c1_seq28:4667-4930(-)
MIFLIVHESNQNKQKIKTCGCDIHVAERGVIACFDFTSLFRTWLPISDISSRVEQHRYFTTTQTILSAVSSGGTSSGFLSTRSTAKN